MHTIRLRSMWDRIDGDQASRVKQLPASIAASNEPVIFRRRFHPPQGSQRVEQVALVVTVVGDATLQAHLNDESLTAVGEPVNSPEDGLEHHFLITDRLQPDLQLELELTRASETGEGNETSLFAVELRIS